ncbi:uncharacterized protein LOC105430667 [Pogonomyrmex barbatus]|uniref:Uncharacterized protein LOC105430667 n=1 Tax=Pogonomyrmex barbatus TaxID=144034 RepID=A0A8N1SA92_9HYME|nr:uncharacterized protein LOC105430667 [Pogonomyrmex barbatus]
MLFYVLSVSIVTTLGLSANVQPTLPLITCKRESADYSACLKRAIKEEWPRFCKGIPEIGFPSLDPLFYKYGKGIFDSGEIRAEVVMKNLTCTGLKESRFSDVRTHFLDDDDVFRLEIAVHAPKLHVKGFVRATGTIGPFRMNSKGPFNVTMDDVTGTWNLIGHVVNDTWIVKNFTVAPTIRTFKLYSDDLFEGNKELNNLILAFVNEYWPPLYRVMLPIMAEIWDPWITGIVNNLFSKVSFSQIFP